MNPMLSGSQKEPAADGRRKLSEIAAVSFKLGLTSFGGPVAHLGYFHHEYVRRKQWLDEKSYADLVALCQFLPGPASSQVGIGIGIVRGGLLGGLIAWLGFTLPSVLALIVFALLMDGANLGSSGFIHGLKLVAVAVVAHAILGMGRKLAADRSRATIALLAAAAVLLWPAAYTQVAAIAAAGAAGALLYRQEAGNGSPKLNIPISRTFGLACLGMFAGLLILLPVFSRLVHTGWAALADSFYRAGSLVFGGGHVVLPLLEREVVPAGWVSAEDFLAGYGMAQAVPGPLFTFASYLGMMAQGWQGAVIATAAIFLPALLLVYGALPFWNTLRSSGRAQGVLSGVNAAVVGLLTAAFYDPLWTSAVQAPADFVLAAALFVLLAFWNAPPWVVVISGSAAGMIADLF